ncbi:MAG: hypothetical protein H6Q90_3029 [Deltaproteobacteria bacterium]|nr:hypothetical protein [Deltaproteobacteria bacterium]
MLSPEDVRLCGIAPDQELDVSGWSPRGSWYAQREPLRVGGYSGVLAVQLGPTHRVSAVQLAVSLGDAAQAFAGEGARPIDLSGWDIVARPTASQRGETSSTRSIYRWGWFEIKLTQALRFIEPGAAPRCEVSYRLTRRSERHPTLEERRAEREAGGRERALLDQIVGSGHQRKK